MVKDATTLQGIPFCTITYKDSTRNLGAVQTSMDGSYTFTLSEPATILIAYNYIGYTSISKKIIIISSRVLPDILLKADTKNLKEVNVTAEKSYIQNTLDKRIINIDKNMVSTGGTAVDILQTLPGVSLNSDEKVEMRGSSNLNIQIDGKPIGSRGGNINTVLEQIPASMIENIEIIGNPSAKYDAEGTGGIINIVLKKNARQGISGNITATVGSRNKYSAGATLSYKNKFMNITANMGFQHNYAYMKGQFNSKNTTPDSTFYQHFRNTGLNKPLNLSPKINFDFYLNKFNTLSVSSSYSINRGIENTQVYRYFYNPDSIIAFESNRDAHTYTRNRYADATLSYKKTFKTPKKEVTIDLYYQNGNEYNLVDANEGYLDKIRVDQVLIQDSIITAVKLHTANALCNYVHPFSTKAFMEIGYSFRFNHTNRNLDYWVQNPYIGASFYSDSNRTNQFVYTEYVNAAYITYNASYEKLSYKIGLRAEDTRTLGQLINTSNTFRNNYFKLFPSLHMNIALPNEQSIRFTYSRRLQRPNINQLNPFGDFTDPRNVRSGNPALQPETTHSFELGYDKVHKKYTLTNTIYYRLQYDMITFIRKVDNEGFGRIQSGNIGMSHNYGIELSGRYSPYKWMNLSLDINVGAQTLIDNRFRDLRNRQNYSYGFNFISAFTPYPFWNISVMYNYRGPNFFPQGRMRSMHGAELGMKFFALKGKLSFNLRFSDVFNTRQFAVEASGFNFESNAVRKRDTRNFFAGITYRFGNSDKSPQNKKKGGFDDPGNSPSMEMF